jgi:hypothetical protein
MMTMMRTATAIRRIVPALIVLASQNRSLPWTEDGGAT